MLPFRSRGSEFVLQKRKRPGDEFFFVLSAGCSMEKKKADWPLCFVTENRGMVFFSYLGTVCAHAYFFLLVHISMCLYTRPYTCLRTCLCTCLYTCLYTCLHSCLHPCLYPCLHSCLYTFLYSCPVHNNQNVVSSVASSQLLRLARVDHYRRQAY